jgi:apolipoprotein N-acyltransferase
MVGLVQPNVPQSEKWHPDLRDAQLADLLERTRGLAEQGADVVIWPEAATPFPIAEMPDLRAAIAQRLGPGGVLLAGGLRIEGRGTAARRFHNSLLAVGGDGTLLKTYDKQHLVPFGEYLPFDDILTGLGLRAVISLPGGFSPGAAQDRVLRVGTLPPFGAMICYEAIFPHEVIDRNADVDWLVHVTNDAWFGRVAGPQQHLAQTRVRAIERGLPVARAANTGISAMIDARGRIVASLPLNTPGTVRHVLPPRVGRTVYSMYEEGLFIMMLLVALISCTLFGKIRL